MGLELGLEDQVWRWRAARPRLFVVVGVQQQPFEVFDPSALAAHELVDDLLGIIVIVVCTRLVEKRIPHGEVGRSHRPFHLRRRRATISKTWLL